LSTLSRGLPNTLSFCLIGLSLLSLCILAILTFKIPMPTTILSWQKQLISSIFGIICLSGIMAGISPSRCSGMLHFKRSKNESSYETKQTSAGETAVRFKGHHPTCGKFSAHVFQLSGKTYCAGCTGLVTGAVVSLLANILYLFASFHTAEAGALAFWLGFWGVACGLLQYGVLDLNRSAVHSFLNVTFVIGALLLLIGVIEVNSNFALELYLLTLIVYWIITRIMLSQAEHKKICASCGSKSCSFT